MSIIFDRFENILELQHYAKDVLRKMRWPILRAQSVPPRAGSSINISFTVSHSKQLFITQHEPRPTLSGQTIRPTRATTSDKGAVVKL